MLTLARALCLIAVIGFPAHPQAAPTQDDVDAAKRIQALAEAEKATAEARKATVEADTATARAKLGTLDLSKLETPTAEAESLSIEGNLLAYAAIRDLGRQIATAIVPIRKPVAIFTAKEMNALAQVRPFTSNLDALKADIATLTALPPPASPPQCTPFVPAGDTGGGSIGLLGSLDVAAQILSVFKTSKTMKGMDVTPDSFALSAAVLDQLRQASIKAIYPPLFHSGSLLKAATLSNVEKQFLNLRSDAPKIDELIVEVGQYQAGLKKIVDADRKPTPGCKAAYAAAAARLDELATSTQTLKARIEKVLVAATTVDEETGATLLETLVAAEALQASATGANILQLRPISAGGTVLTKKSVFASSFRFSGGAVVAYMLVSSADGTILHSGIVGGYGGDVKPDQLQAFVNKSFPLVPAMAQGQPVCAVPSKAQDQPPPPAKVSARPAQ